MGRTELFGRYLNGLVNYPFGSCNKLYGVEKLFISRAINFSSYLPDGYYTVLLYANSPSLGIMVKLIAWEHGESHVIACYPLKVIAEDTKRGLSDIWLFAELLKVRKEELLESIVHYSTR